uniref:Uncharacterized protein n=1 Tax=Arundo donax TaxID=35708 RepID=A0A0A9FBA0_ARUDO
MLLRYWFRYMCYLYDRMLMYVSELAISCSSELK